MTLSRIEKLKKGFTESQIDGMIISSQFNRFYLSGFTGTSGTVLIGREKKYLLTDSRYTEQAKEQCSGFEIIDAGKDFYKILNNVLGDNNISSLGFEDNHISYREYMDYKDKITGIDFVPIRKSIEKIREKKENDEIENIRKAAEIADSSFKHILNFIKPGVKEKDVSLEMEYFMRKAGASSISFDTIIASGKRSSLPHGVASEKVIEFGDTVTLDFGCIYQGYCSDMTRTIFIGKSDNNIRKIYDIVLRAQESALDIISAGVACKDVDAAARSIISEHGYGEKFGHGLGHSVGLEVHEDPTLSSRNESKLEPGMVVTIEPGIYLEEVGGVRIEDMVVIMEGGVENLISSTKEIVVI